MTTQTQPRPRTLTYYTAWVAGLRQLTPHMVRVSLVGDELRELVNPGPDAYIKLFFPLRGQPRPVLPPADSDGSVSWYRTYLAMPDDVRPAMRTYTIRAHRPANGEIDVDFVMHAGSGPATRWVQTAQPGDEVAFIEPHGLYTVPTGASWQLIIGDETALPAIMSIVEGLPEGACARAFVEVEGPADELSVPPQDDVRINWVHRGNASHGKRLLEAVHAARLPAGSPYAWIAGESGLVKFTRRHLVRERGVAKRMITFTGYWRIGTSEEDASRENIRKIQAGEAIRDEG